jgi:hypothetical protein
VSNRRLNPSPVPLNLNPGLVPLNKEGEKTCGSGTAVKIIQRAEGKASRVQKIGARVSVGVVDGADV